MSDLSGWVGAIPCGKNRYLCKDIDEMTNEEFVEWLFAVYPDPSIMDVPPDIYEDPLMRQAEIEKALVFHQLVFSLKPKLI